MKITDNEIIELFLKVSKMSRYISAPDAHGKNLIPYMGQYKCLFFLEHAGTVNQRKMADALQIRPASLSELLSKLEQKGYITRTPSPKDKRSHLVALTETGVREAKKSRIRQQEVHSEMLSALSDEEKQQFYHILTKMEQSKRGERYDGQEENLNIY